MTTTFTITGRDIHTDQGDANTFKGFGYLNCNNSSRLLLDLQMAAAGGLSGVVTYSLRRAASADADAESRTGCRCQHILGHGTQSQAQRCGRRSGGGVSLSH